MNKGINFPCVTNMHFNSTSTETAWLVNNELKSFTESTSIYIH